MRQNTGEENRYGIFFLLYLSVHRGDFFKKIGHKCFQVMSDDQSHLSTQCKYVVFHSILVIFICFYPVEQYLPH